MLPFVFRLVRATVCVPVTSRLADPEPCRWRHYPKPESVANSPGLVKW